MAKRTHWYHVVAMLLFCLLLVGYGNGASASSSQVIPEKISQIFNKPLYRNAVWGMRVVDLDTGQLLYDMHSERAFLIGSVRKLFSVGLYECI